MNREGAFDSIIGSSRSSLAVTRKEFAAEYRTRSGPIATGMFVLVISVVVAFSLGVERIGPQTTAALLWISFFFTSIAGLIRSYTQEVERGTLDFLRLHVAPAPIYLGKLLYNLAVAATSNLCVALLYLLFISGAWRGGILDLLVGTLLISYAMAAAVTIVSALLSHAAGKGALGTVLAIPLLMPVAYLGVELLATGAAGGGGSTTVEIGSLILAYGTIVIILSTILLDFIWEE